MFFQFTCNSLKLSIVEIIGKPPHDSDDAASQILTFVVQICHHRTKQVFVEMTTRPLVGTKIALGDEMRIIVVCFMKEKVH